MVSRTDVNLPKNHQVRFPDRCVVCGEESPNSTVTLITSSLAWWAFLLLVIGRPFKVTAPACRWCGWRLQWSRFVSLLVAFAFIYIAFWVLWPMFGAQVPQAIRRWVKIAFAVACCTPLIIYEVFFPKPFAITAFSDSVDYEFTDELAAYEFAQENEDADWVKIS